MTLKYKSSYGGQVQAYEVLCVEYTWLSYCVIVLPDSVGGVGCSTGATMVKSGEVMLAHVKPVCMTLRTSASDIEPQYVQRPWRRHNIAKATTSSQVLFTPIERSCLGPGGELTHQLTKQIMNAQQGGRIVHVVHLT